MQCFLHFSQLSNWQAFIWLWLNDTKAKFYWLKCFLASMFTRKPLNKAVADNVADFGIEHQSGKFIVYTDKWDLELYER